jgi:copper chaperone CopZ
MSVKSMLAVTAVLAGVGVASVVRPAATPQAQVAEQPARAETCWLKVSGMTCAGCEVAVRMAAKSVDGVTDVVVSHKTGRADVTYDPAKSTPSAVAKAITDGSGFKADVDSRKDQ